MVFMRSLEGQSFLLNKLKRVKYGKIAFITSGKEVNVFWIIRPLIFYFKGDSEVA